MIETHRSQQNIDNSISRAADRKNQYYSLLYSEMAERKRAEESLSRSNMLLQALSNAQLQYVAGTQLAEVFSSLLQTLLDVTMAHQGFLCDEHPTQVATSDDGLKIIEGSFADTAKVTYFRAIAVQVVQESRILLAHPASKSNSLAPVDETDAAYYLGIPITTTPRSHQGDDASAVIPDENLVGAIVLSGRAEEFDPSIVDLMQPLVVTCAQLIMAHRNDTRRRAAEVALVEERALLAERVAERTAELSYSNAELARAARAKDEFLATMNHELRTPLNAVLLYAESLQTQRPGPLNERQLRAATGIRESANHLLLLINDILDVAKMDAGKLSLDIKVTSTEALCQSSLRLVSELAHKKHLELHFDRDEKISQLDVDERRLKQMLVNLLSNAIKFTADGGSVGLTVTGDENNNFVHFTVWDTGIGITQDDIKKLFQPFAQLDSSHVRQHGGTGLGLFLVYRMAELHGGSVSVTSEVNKGSHFTISVPWHHQRQNYKLSEMISSVNAQHAATKAEEGIVHKWENLPPPSSDKDHSNHSPSKEVSAASTVQARDIPPATNISQASRPTPHTNTASYSMPTYSVLIADDNEANLLVLSDFLQEWDCRVLVARTGVEALISAKEWQPTLILMDIQMPEMNGLDAIRLIRRESKLHQTPIVAVTALAMPGDREQCLAAGANDYISKPIHLERLTEVVSTYLAPRPLKELP